MPAPFAVIRGHWSKVRASARYPAIDMAVVWRKQLRGVRYEVRTAGRTHRLYTNGVLHSQYNPAQPVTGGVWDLLVLPAFFHKAGRTRRVLVLGVGGGAVVRLLANLVRPREIVGIELNPVHLYLARRFFGVGDQDVVLHQADATHWLTTYTGPPFDLIVDDLFADDDGEPVRAVEADTDWFELLSKHLTPEGALAINFPSSDTCAESAYQHDAGVRAAFAAAYQFTTPAYGNVVAAYLRRDASGQGLRRQLCADERLRSALAGRRLRYRIRRIPDPLGAQ